MTDDGRRIFMGNGARIWLGTAVSALLFLVAASPAAAVDIIEGKPETTEAGWQAGTCTTDVPECSVDTPKQFSTQASSHPGAGFTQIIVKHDQGTNEPVGDLKTVLVDLPKGLSVNPQATPQCALVNGKFPPGGCPVDTAVGYSLVTVYLPVLGPTGPLSFPVYNIVPRQGEPARFGFDLSAVGIIELGEVFLNAGVKWDGDYHEYFTIHVPEPPPLTRILKNRLVFDGTIGTSGQGGAFITTPSTCYDPNQPAYATVYNTLLHADSKQEEAPQNLYDVAAPAPPPPAFLAGSQLVESPLPKEGGSGPRVKPTGCDKVPFKPTTSQASGTNQTDSPMGGTVEVKVPFSPSAPIYQSNVKTADVSLPQGLGVNPSAASGLQACSDAQFGQGTRNKVACPPGSKIGSVEIDTPPLPDGTLKGDVYLATQQSRDPESGDEYRIFIDAESEARGLSIRLLGNVKANAQTGQLTAQVKEAPQLPFDSVRVSLDGAKGPLTSPPTCGPNNTSHAMQAWSGTPDQGDPGTGFTLTSAPGGAPCAKTLGERPFAPSFGTHTSNSKGGAFTQFAMNIGRKDGNQELKGVEVTLPPGLTAKLAGVRYCPGSAIAAAAANSGAAEAAHSSCPSQSLVGSAAVSAGSGSHPFQTTGKAFLAGPYHGAPLSLAVVTPATAGPFDLGTVVVRVALFVDPETAQVNPVSDPIPHVFGGALLDVRSISVKLDRPKFSINPTNCSKFATSGALRGGGSNPLDPAAFSSYSVSSSFQVEDCDKLDFKPKLKMRLFGGHRRAKSPKLRAILTAREGDANIGRAAVTLPKSLALEQSSLANVCTRVQFAANKCPKDSVYGNAVAETPLLDGPLKGPIYLRSSNNELPDFVADLDGQVPIVLDGRIDSVKGRLRTTFATVPDVPVSRFVVNVRGGKRGLLVSTRNICGHKYKAVARFKGQNGKKSNQRPLLKTNCKKKRHHKKRRKGAGR